MTDKQRVFIHTYMHTCVKGERKVSLSVKKLLQSPPRTVYFLYLTYFVPDGISQKLGINSSLPEL